MTPSVLASHLCQLIKYSGAPSRERQTNRSNRGSSRRDDNKANTGSQSKGGTAVCRTELDAARDGRSYSAGETEDECGRQTGDHRGNEEALGGDQGGEGCCGGAGSGCGEGQGSARQSSRASQEGRSHRSGTQGAVHRNEETVGGEKEGGREGESGLSRLTFTRQETQGRAD